MIPKHIHFIFGLDESNSKPFTCVHYIAVLSAKSINVGYDIVIHYYKEPVNNEWWERCKQIVILNKLQTVPDKIFGNDIFHFPHKADVLRLEILSVEGGIYLDLDTICITSFDPLLLNSCVMGLEIWQGNINGLCNAVILAEKNSPFINSWYNSYVEFDTNDWNKMSIRKPFELYLQNRSLVHIEPPESFFRITWSDEDSKLIYEKTISFDLSYCLHLWETITYSKYLSNISIENIKTINNSYNVIARRFV